MWAGIAGAGVIAHQRWKLEAKAAVILFGVKEEAAKAAGMTPEEYAQFKPQTDNLGRAVAPVTLAEVEAAAKDTPIVHRRDGRVVILPGTRHAIELTI